MRVTKMAGGTFIRQHHAWIIFAGIHRQDFGRAEFDTNTAALAPGGVNGHFTARPFFGRDRRDDG